MAWRKLTLGLAIAGPHSPCRGGLNPGSDQLDPPGRPNAWKAAAGKITPQPRPKLRRTCPRPLNPRAKDWISPLRCQFAGLPDPLLDLGLRPVVVQRTSHGFWGRAGQLGVRLDPCCVKPLLRGRADPANDG